MSDRSMRRFIGDLTEDKPTQPAQPDADEAAQMRAAIELRAAGRGAGVPSPEFIERLAAQLRQQAEQQPTADGDGQQPGHGDGVQAGSVVDLPLGKTRSSTRRQVLIGGSVAAGAAVLGGAVDRTLLSGPREVADEPATQSTLDPNAGVWHTVAISSDVPEGSTVAFDVGTINGFVQRTEGAVSGLSGVCTHQGCRLWLDAPDRLLRCPCHRTSFTLTGQVSTHQLPLAPRPLPKLTVREVEGRIEVLAPAKDA